MSRDRTVEQTSLTTTGNGQRCTTTAYLVQPQRHYTVDYKDLEWVLIVKGAPSGTPLDENQAISDEVAMFAAGKTVIGNAISGMIAAIAAQSSSVLYQSDGFLEIRHWSADGGWRNFGDPFLTKKTVCEGQ